MREPLWVSLQFVLAVHDRSLSDHGGREAVRDIGLLESAIDRARNQYRYGKPTLFELAAAYAFGIAKNHPFIDGNKRTAFVTAAAFLDANGFELTASEVDATTEMLALAAGERTEKQMAAWFAANTVRMKK
jgi:death-on-curing protein